MRRTMLAFAALFACSSAPAPRPPPQPSGQAAPPLVAMGVDESAMDASADPCADFYQYACGGWLKKNPIPADKSTWGRSFSTIFDHNEAMLRQIMEADARGEADPADPYAKKVGDFYATCMDEEKAETASLRTLKEILGKMIAQE